MQPERSPRDVACPHHRTSRVPELPDDNDCASNENTNGDKRGYAGGRRSLGAAHGLVVGGLHAKGVAVRHLCLYLCLLLFRQGKVQTVDFEGRRRLGVAWDEVRWGKNVREVRRLVVVLVRVLGGWDV